MQQLADKSGYTVASINTIEKGRQRTPPFELFKIGEALGLSDPRVLLPNIIENGDEDTHGPSDDVIDLDVALNGSEMTLAAAAFSAAELAEENAAIAQELGLGSSVVMVPETPDSETRGIDDAPECRLCGGPLDNRMDREFGIHSKACRQAETDAKRQENGTMNIPTVSYDSEYFFDPSTPKEERVQKPGVSAVTIGGATVRFDDPRIIPVPNPHKPEETAFQAGQYVWASREDAAGYLAAQDSGSAGARITADDDPNVRRATGSESCGICSREIERDSAILEVKGAGGISTDVGPCCQQYYV